jgi:hypothetical protein
MNVETEHLVDSGVEWTIDCNSRNQISYMQIYSYKGKIKTHNYINRQNQSTTGKL